MSAAERITHAAIDEDHGRPPKPCARILGQANGLGRGGLTWPVLDHSDPAEWLGRPLNSRGIAAPDGRQARHHLIVGKALMAA